LTDNEGTVELSFVSMQHRPNCTKTDVLFIAAGDIDFYYTADSDNSWAPHPWTHCSVATATTVMRTRRNVTLYVRRLTCSQCREKFKTQTRWEMYYDVTLWCVRVTVVARERQHARSCELQNRPEVFK